MKYTMRQLLFLMLSMAGVALLLSSCGNQGRSSNGALSSNAAERVFIPPGEYDEFYGFLSGGFSGQLAVYGIPSGRLLRVIPVFSQDPESGYGYSEETKPMRSEEHTSELQSRGQLVC